jgi:uncharacterized protein (DUF2384 family)
MSMNAPDRPDTKYSTSYPPPSGARERRERISDIVGKQDQMPMNAPDRRPAPREFVKNLTRVMAFLGVNATESAAILGVTPESYSELISGNRRMTDKESERYAAVLEVVQALREHFSNPKYIKEWLRDPETFGGRTPLEIMYLPEGQRLILGYIKSSDKKSDR